MSKSKEMSPGVILLLTFAVSVVLLAALGGLCFGVVSCVKGCGVGQPRLRDRSVTVSEPFEGVSIDTALADIEIAPSEDGSVRIELREAKKLAFTCEVSEGLLKIVQRDMRKGVSRLALIVHDPQATLYLPAGEYASLTVNANKGCVTVKSGLSFLRAEIKTVSASVDCEAEAEIIEISSEFGDVSLKGMTAGRINAVMGEGAFTAEGVSSAERLSAISFSGRVELKDALCGDIDISAEESEIIFDNVTASGYLLAYSAEGSIEFKSSDAASIKAATVSGDITGTLRTGKIYAAPEDPSRVSVPASAEGGGLCELESETGRINIEIG